MGDAYFRPSDQAQGLANYPHARTVPAGRGRCIYVSGTSSRQGDGTFVGADPVAGGLDIGLQSAAVLRNVDVVIRGASRGKATIANVVDATVFLTDIKAHYDGMNREWNRVWPDPAAAPARTTVEVRALPRKEILVEVKCTAYYEDV